MCQLMSSDFTMAEIPCKYIPFKALKVGEVVKLSFSLKQDKLKKEMCDFERRILDNI
jgi:hypothetical protein